MLPAAIKDFLNGLSLNENAQQTKDRIDTKMSAKGDINIGEMNLTLVTLVQGEEGKASPLLNEAEFEIIRDDKIVDDIIKEKRVDDYPAVTRLKDYLSPRDLTILKIVYNIKYYEDNDENNIADDMLISLKRNYGERAKRIYHIMEMDMFELDFLPLLDDLENNISKEPSEINYIQEVGEKFRKHFDDILHYHHFAIFVAGQSDSDVYRRIELRMIRETQNSLLVFARGPDNKSRVESICNQYCKNNPDYTYGMLDRELRGLDACTIYITRAKKPDGEDDFIDPDDAFGIK